MAVTNFPDNPEVDDIHLTATGAAFKWDGVKWVREGFSTLKIDPGTAVPNGGFTGQVLAKSSGINHDTEWTTMTTLAGSASVGTLSYNGLTPLAGAFYGGTIAPSSSNRLNYEGNLHANSIMATNDITAFASDERLKKDVQGLDNALDKVNSLNGFTYSWNEKASELINVNVTDRYSGVSAQEVNSVLPEAVRLAPFDTDENMKSKSGEEYLTVQYEKLVPLLIEAIKELSAEVEALKKGG